MRGTEKDYPTELARYVDKMRQRHPRLTMRQMALGADLSDSMVYKIVSRGRIPELGTIKKLADAWGEPGDFRSMAEIAGYPMPDNTPHDPGIALEGTEGILSEGVTLKELIAVVAELTPSERERWLNEALDRLRDRIDRD